jgi:cell division transport system permease protein
MAGSLVRLARSPWSTLFTALAIGVALSLPAGFFVAVKNLRLLAGNVAVEPEITVFLVDEASQDAVHQVERSLVSHPRVKSVRFVGRDDALAGLKSRAGLSDVLAGLDRNPLPDAFVVVSRESDPAAIAALAEEIRSWKPVAHVQHDADWARRLNAISAVGRQLSLILAVLLGSAFIAITANTIRLQIAQRRDEIEVARLIGATDPFVRRPFLYFGALQGALGGATAWMLITVSIRLLQETAGELTAAYGTRVPLQSLSPVEGGIAIAIAALLGWLGAFLGVGRALAQFDRHP